MNDKIEKDYNKMIIVKKILGKTLVRKSEYEMLLKEGKAKNTALKNIELTIISLKDKISRYTKDFYNKYSNEEITSFINSLT